MTTLAIMANYEKKRLKCYGTVAAGEHVAVTVTDGAQWLGEGMSLRLRVLFGPSLVGVFPYHTEPHEVDGATVPADAWQTHDDDPSIAEGDARCELNLNTLQAEKYLKCGGTCLWILDDVENHTLYATGEVDVLAWPKRRGVDTPIDLDGYPHLIEDIADLKAAFEAYQQTVAQALATKQDVIADLATIRSGAAAGTSAVQPSQIARFVDGAEYRQSYGEQNRPALLFKHGSDVVVAVDATPFVKDGMVADVGVSGGKLVITFNTDSGKRPVEIPLTDIFNPNAYYDKGTVDAKLAPKADKTITVVPAHGLPADCYPVVYVDKGGTTHTITGDADIRENGPRYYTLYDSDRMVCHFTKSTGKYFTGADITSITFNGTAPTQNTWPVLTSAAVTSSVVYDKDIVAPSTAPAASGKAADAKATGDALAGKASKSDATLTPVYGGNGERFSEWTSNDGLNHNIRWDGSKWEVVGEGAFDPPECYDFDATSISSEDFGFTATRTENPIIGYQLGLQSDSRLGPLDNFNFASPYSSFGTYAVGDLCFHNGQLYKCSTAISTAEAWNPGHWSPTTVGEALAGKQAKGMMSSYPRPMGGVESEANKLLRAMNPHVSFDINGSTYTLPQSEKVAAQLLKRLDATSVAPEYSSSATYAVGDLCVNNGKLYRCSTAIPSAEAWDATHWTATTVEALTTLTPIYSDTPTFSEWSVKESDYISIEINGQGKWTPYETDPADPLIHTPLGNPKGNEQSIFLQWEEGVDASRDITATRVRTDIIGYQLGSQSDKPLQPKGDYPTKAQMDAGWWSEWELAGSLPFDAEIIPSTSSRPNPSYHPDPDHWQLEVLYNGDVKIGACSGSEDADRLEIEFDEESGLSAYTVIATRHRVAAPVPTKPEDIGAANRAANPTAGNLAALDAQGNPTDSGIAKTAVALLASPAFTGTPTAPTPTAGDDSTKIATTAFVQAAVAGATPNLDYVMRVDPETGGIYYTTPDTNA